MRPLPQTKQLNSLDQIFSLALRETLSLLVAAILILRFFLGFFATGSPGNCVFTMVGAAGTPWPSLFRMSTMSVPSRTPKDPNCASVGSIVRLLCFKVILSLVKTPPVVSCTRPRKASTVASVCSRASAVSLGFKDRLGFTRSSSTRANSTYRHRELPLRRRLSLIHPFYGHTVHFLVPIEVVRVVARPALRRRSPSFAVCFPALFTDPCARSPRSSSVAVAFAHIFPTPLARDARLATPHPRVIARRLRASTRICTVSSASRTSTESRAHLRPFSLSAPLFRVDHRASLVSLRSSRVCARARPFVVPRPPVRVVVRAPLARRIVSILHRSTFARLSRRRPLARAIARASHRAHPLSSSPRAPPPFASTRASSRAASAECGRPTSRGRSPREPSRRWRFYLFIDARDRDRLIAVSTRTLRRSIAIAVPTRARDPDRPTADRRPPTSTRRGEATPRRRGGDGTRRDSATRSTASARANERERARVERSSDAPNERERTRATRASSGRDDARAPTTAPHGVSLAVRIIRTRARDGFDGRGDERAIER